MTKKTESRRSIGARRSPESAEAILNAAEELLEEHGYKGFSIDEVARRARAGKPTIYKWWPSKAALLLDVYLRQKSISFKLTGALDADIANFIAKILSHWHDSSAGEIFRSVVAEAQTNTSAAQALTKFALTKEAETSFIIQRGLENGEVDKNLQPINAARWISSYLWYRLLTGQTDVDLEQIRCDVKILVSGIKKRS